MTDIRVTIPPGLVYAWRSQADQFPKRGEPGITYETHDVPVLIDGVTHPNVVECLLYRNKHGRLVGILYYYPEGAIERDGTPLERPGAMSCWVKPECQRQGIATTLAQAGELRWGKPDLSVQRFTAEGAALARRLYGDGGT